MFYTMILGDDIGHPATYEMFFLTKETSGVIPRLWAQSRQQPTIPATILRLLQQEFDDRLWQVLERWQKV